MQWSARLEFKRLPTILQGTLDGGTPYTLPNDSSEKEKNEKPHSDHLLDLIINMLPSFSTYYEKGRQ